VLPSDCCGRFPSQVLLAFLAADSYLSDLMILGRDRKTSE
jgi:hypothetical protein